MSASGNVSLRGTADNRAPLVSGDVPRLLPGGRQLSHTTYELTVVGREFGAILLRDRGAELIAWRGAYLRWHGALTRLQPAFPELAPLRAPERPWEA